MRASGDPDTGDVSELRPGHERTPDMDPAAQTVSTTGYGRRADIWSLGITVVEMATGHCPFRNAATAIYSIFVAKELPRLPLRMTSEAVAFVDRCSGPGRGGWSTLLCLFLHKNQSNNLIINEMILRRCLVVDPNQRADCRELQAHPFCIPQVMLLVPVRFCISLRQLEGLV